MSKDKYISDHLVDMRDHLKRNYEKLHADGTAESPEADNPLEKRVSDSDPVSAVTEQQVKRLPSIRNVSDTPVDRERRELEGKVLHDLNLVETQLGLLKQQLAEAERFYTVLSREYGELQELSGRDDRGALARLQLEYFAASGRNKAFFTDHSGKSGLSPVENTHSSNRGNYLVAGAIILGSILVSAAMFCLFA